VEAVEHFGAVFPPTRFDYCLVAFLICSAAHQIELSLGLAGSL